jgi:S-formylglutathione hydrolase
MNRPFPRTGQPLTRNLLVALLVAALALSSCGRSESEPAPAPTETTAAIVAPTTVPSTAAPATEPPAIEAPEAEPAAGTDAVETDDTPATVEPPATVTTATVTEATPTTQPQRIIRATIAAPSLAANLVGEKPERPIMVYLPPSYDSSDARFPVIYYLPGYGDSDFLGFVPGRDSDDLMASGAIPEFIFVSANGINEVGGSFYVNSPVTGNWEDFVAEDVVSYVDANFRTLAQPESRGLAGHSMGGFGALNMAMHRPDVFGAVYSMSPGAFDLDGLSESQMFADERAIRAYLAMEDELAGLPTEEAAKKMTRQFGDLGFALAYGLAFAPNPERQPPLSDYPYTREGEQLVRDETIWQRWEAGYGGNAAKVEEYADNLKLLRGLVVDVGVYDNYGWIPKGVAYLGEQLEAAGIPAEVLTYEGSHQDKLKQRWLESALPFFASTLEAGDQ